jgi:hypothetical protein
MDKSKIRKNYELTYFILEKNVLTVRPPFTIEFEIHRKNFGASNTGSIRIYNLKKEARSLIRKDFIDFNMLNKVILKAGYGDDLSEILNMSVSQAWSVRERVNFISQISCMDGGYALVNGTINQTFSEGENIREVLKKMARLGQQQNLGITTGAISQSYAAEVLQRPITYSGSWWDIINQVSNQGAFIDNSTINILKENEYIEQTVFIVNSASGLLGTPTREQNFVNFEMLFEPKLKPGCLVRLETSTGDEDMNNTLYVVQQLIHRGMISESVPASVVTEVGCYPGPTIGVKPEVSR